MQGWPKLLKLIIKRHSGKNKDIILQLNKKVQLQKDKRLQEIFLHNSKLVNLLVKNESN